LAGHSLLRSRTAAAAIPLKGTKILRVGDTTLRIQLSVPKGTQTAQLLRIRHSRKTPKNGCRLMWWRAYVCGMKQQLSGPTCIVMGAAIPGVENMTRANLRCDPGRQRGDPLEYAMPTIRCACVVLFLLLSPTLVWTQTAELDKQSAPMPEQQAQQSGSTVESVTQPDAATEPKPLMDMPTPAVNPTPVNPKTNSSEGQQTKRMFWIIPNFAAVSADAETQPLTTRGKYTIAMQDSVDYSSFVWAGMLAGQSMALRSYPELRNGVAGYSRY